MACTCQEQWGDQYPVAATCIGRVWLFNDLPAPERAALVAAATRKLYPKGAAIFREGEPATQMFLVKAGRVKLSKLTVAGMELTLDYRKAGDFLGETVLHTQAAYPLTAICTEDTITCGFTKARFEALVLEHPHIGLQVIRNLSKRMGILAERVESVAGPSVTERVYQSLLNLAGEHGRESPAGLELDLPFTHEELSFLVGAHRVTVTRALKELRADGRIVQDGRRIILGPGNGVTPTR
jgi:CRP/FNR family transcriptional regulator, cyclic AMP receptor protein